MKTGDTISFPCPHCGARMQCKDSRPTTYQGKHAIRRRRQCGRCARRLTSFEIVDNGEGSAHRRLAELLGQIRRAHEALGEMLDRYESEPEGNGVDADEARAS